MPEADPLRSSAAHERVGMRISKHFSGVLPAGPRVAPTQVVCQHALCDGVGSSDSLLVFARITATF